MRARLVAATAVAALALPALALAQPNNYQLTTAVQPGATASLRVGTVPQGQFSFGLRVSSDGDKNFTLTQQRNGGSAFTVISGPGGPGTSSCQGAAGSLFCTGITTPATPGNRTWTWRFRNRSSRPMNVVLTIAWKHVVGG